MADEIRSKTGLGAGLLLLGRLLKRPEYQAVAARGVRIHKPSFTLQYWPRPEEAHARIGFTVTKKEGGAVERNRIRRRLKEAVRTCGLKSPVSADMVLIGRSAAAAAPFQSLVADLKEALVEAAKRAARRAANPAARTPEPPAD
jgi:ribonuclease P protein component